MAEASYLLWNEGRAISECLLRVILSLHVEIIPETPEQWKWGCPWQMGPSWILPCPSLCSPAGTRDTARAGIFPALAAGGFLPSLGSPREVWGAALGWCWPQSFALLSAFNQVLVLWLCSVPRGVITMKDLSAFSGEGVNFRHLKLSNKSCFKQE